MRTATSENMEARKTRMSKWGWGRPSFILAGKGSTPEKMAGMHKLLFIGMSGTGSIAHDEQSEREKEKRDGIERPFG